MNVTDDRRQTDGRQQIANTNTSSRSLKRMTYHSLNGLGYGQVTVFTARRNAGTASAVLATAIPSVCLSVRPSVTRRYCVKTTARSTVQFVLSDSKMCLVL